jgi:hypothetical protein
MRRSRGMIRCHDRETLDGSHSIARAPGGQPVGVCDVPQALVGVWHTPCATPEQRGDSQTFKTRTILEEETSTMARSHALRLLDVIQAVSECATSDRETLATVAYLINSGKVRLCGDFSGAMVALPVGRRAAPWYRATIPDKCVTA